MKLTLLLLVVSSTFSCHTHETEEQVLNNLIVHADRQELDRTLTLWFDEFTENQAMGFDMYQADHLATKRVLINSK